MSSQLTKFKYGDEDYQAEKAPKRCNYRKIKLKIKKQMIKRHVELGQSISTLSKSFHLSYSTIAHIVKTYKEKKVVFQSKRLKMLREIDEALKAQNQQTTPKLDQEAPKMEKNLDQRQYYPFADYWPYYYT